MKKILLSLLLVAATSANAQTALNLKKSFEGNSFRFVPKMFAYEEKMQIVLGSESSFDIYNANLQKVHSINKNSDFDRYGRVQYISFYDWDQNSHPDYSFYFTQTLFNDDEKYEYVTKHYSSESDEYGSTYVDGFNIVSDDGTILQTVMFDERTDFNSVKVWKIEGKIYFIVSNYFYEIEKGSATAVRQVASLPASPDNSIYNLNGQKMKNVTTNGVYIQNGQKKVVKK
ncbi:MAG: hypothetical protein IKW78_08980 [Prevotella sp.]|nr:hypothetical protein [Prevotella sp.]